MKKIILTCLAIGLFFPVYSQYSYSVDSTFNYPIELADSTTAAVPGWEYPAGTSLLDSAWLIILEPQLEPTWSTNQTLPFPFEFNGETVSEYKVSNSGVLTFSTAATFAPVFDNAALPATDIPDNSLCLWGLRGIGTNDNVVVRTFGESPNRKHWIFYNSYSYETSTQCWTYFSIVLEESTNNIYLLDQRRSPGCSGVPSSLSLGIQIDNSTAFDVPGTPDYDMMATIEANNSGNVHHLFAPEVVISTQKIEKTDISDLLCIPNPNNGNFRLSFELGKSDDAAILLQDLTGKVLFSEYLENVSRYNEQIDLEHLSAGIYIISVKNSQGIKTEKVSIH